MGRALYITVSRRQWADARRFLSAYERLPDHDPMMVSFAKGGLARADGDLAGAEKHYRNVLAIQADFLLGQLELARVLFENRKDREAREAFEQIRAQIVSEGDKASGVIVTVDAFLKALRQRRGWHGSLALGPIYGTVRISVCGRAVDHQAAMALMKRSPKITANCAFAMVHSRGGIFHSFSDRFKIR